MSKLPDVRDAIGMHPCQRRTLADVLEFVCAQPPKRRRLIGVDGFKWHGKSWIAREIAKALGTGYVEADDYPDEMKLSTPCDPIPRYVEVLNLNAIRDAVDTAVREKGGAVLDGVCNLELCQAIGRPRSFGVYVLSRIPIPIPGEACAPTCGLYLLEYHERFNAVAAADVLIHNPWPRFPGEDLRFR